MPYSAIIDRYLGFLLYLLNVVFDIVQHTIRREGRSTQRLVCIAMDLLLQTVVLDLEPRVLGD